MTDSYRLVPKRMSAELITFEPVLMPPDSCTDNCRQTPPPHPYPLLSLFYSGTVPNVLSEALRSQFDACRVNSFSGTTSDPMVIN
jgi:hypothetical protein